MSTGENTERETAETVPPSVVTKKPFYIPIASEFVEGATNAIYPYARDAGWLGGKFLEGARSAFQPLGRDLNWIGGGIKGVLETPTPNKQQNLGIGYGSGRSYRKQGGTINKFQRGTQGSGITRANLPTTSKWNIFGFQPNSAKWFPTDRDLPKGQTEEVSRYMHRNKDITTLRRPRPYYTADQPSMYNSTRTINWDNNTPVDTTYTYGNKVIQPNTIDHERYKAAFAGGDRALLQNIGKRQQGGAIQQQGVDKEALVADFVVRYLKTMGVPEEAIVTPEGSVNPEYEKELTAVITEIDSPEFWEAYQSSPDEVVTQVVRERNPNAVTMAKKGTKLKRLSQLRIYKK